MTPVAPSLYDPFSPDFPECAQEVYDRLRVEAPFHWAPQVQEWIVTRHGDVRTVLRHPGLRPVDIAAYLEHMAREAALPLPALRLLVGESVFLQTGPGHVLARRFMARMMNERPLVESAPEIEAIVEERIEALRKAGGGDLVADFARAVPLRFMGGWLGVPPEEMEFLADCAEDTVQILERRREVARCVELNSRAALAIEHLGGLCASRRAMPRDDGLSRLMELAKTEPDLDDRVMAARVFFLFIAGLDTTTTFLGRAMLALLADDEERSRWRRGAVTDSGAVEELLRYTSPAALVMRVAIEDGEVCGHAVARGQRVTAVIEAANRDPGIFTEPHRLDLGRAVCPHLSFSDGVHACLGASLARMKGAIALRAFVRLPAMRLREAPQAARAHVLKALKSLPVILS